MKITNCEYVTSCVKKSQFPQDKPMFAFVGRSNVGKSSFINTLTNRKNLAYTSSNPGKTITLNFYNINNSIYFVDVPGYGFANRTKEARIKFGQMMEDLIIDNKLLKKVFLIVDIRIKPTEDDVLMYEWLKYYHVDIAVIATKIDKIGSTKLLQHEKVIRETLNIDKNQPIYKVSSFKKQGFESILSLLD